MNDLRQSEQNWYFHPPLAMPPWGWEHNAYTDGVLYTDKEQQRLQNPTQAFKNWDRHHRADMSNYRWAAGICIVSTILAMTIHPLWIVFVPLTILNLIFRAKHPTAHAVFTVVSTASLIYDLQKPVSKGGLRGLGNMGSGGPLR